MRHPGHCAKTLKGSLTPFDALALAQGRRSSQRLKGRENKRYFSKLWTLNSELFFPGGLRIENLLHPDTGAPVHNFYFHFPPVTSNFFSHLTFKVVFSGFTPKYYDSEQE